MLWDWVASDLNSAHCVFPAWGSPSALSPLGMAVRKDMAFSKWLPTKRRVFTSGGSGLKFGYGNWPRTLLKLDSWAEQYALSFAMNSGEMAGLVFAWEAIGELSRHKPAIRDAAPAQSLFRTYASSLAASAASIARRTPP